MAAASSARQSGRPQNKHDTHAAKHKPKYVSKVHRTPLNAHVKTRENIMSRKL